MKSFKHVFMVAFLVCAAAGRALAADDGPTPLDVQYDGSYHTSITPYVWLPTINGNFQFKTPDFKLPPGSGQSANINVQSGPNSYLSKINAAAMMAFTVRKGDVDFFGDYIYVNAVTGGTTVKSISGPGGKIDIPVDLGSNVRVATSIWELGAGYTVARGHNVDLELFTAWRQAPVQETLNYNVTVGKNVVITKAGTIRATQVVNDIAFGLKGKAYIDRHWFLPYYVDLGAGYNNQEWQAYGGVAYQFRTQSLMLLVRNMSFYSFPSDSPVQKLSFGGPLIGYSIGL